MGNAAEKLPLSNDEVEVTDDMIIGIEEETSNGQGEKMKGLLDKKTLEEEMKKNPVSRKVPLPGVSPNETQDALDELRQINDESQAEKAASKEGEEEDDNSAAAKMKEVESKAAAARQARIEGMGKRVDATMAREDRIEAMGNRVDAVMAVDDLKEAKRNDEAGTWKELKAIREKVALKLDEEKFFADGEKEIPNDAAFNLNIEHSTFAPDGPMSKEIASLMTSGALPESFNSKMYLAAEAGYESSRKRYDEAMSKGFFSRLKNRKEIKILKNQLDKASERVAEGREMLLDARKGTAPETKAEAPKTASEEEKALANVEGRDLPEGFHKNKYIDTAHLVDELGKELKEIEMSEVKETKTLSKKRKELKKALDKLSSYEDQLK